jgi:hypothetical protein
VGVAAGDADSLDQRFEAEVEGSVGAVADIDDVKATTIVLDGDLEPPAPLVQPDGDAVGAGVAAYVCQRLLR